MTVRFVVPTRLEGSIEAPPSKSYTHRALVCAHLAGARVRIRSPLESDDTRRTADGIATLGARVLRDAREWIVEPAPPSHRARRQTIFCGESGTTARFLTAAAALLPTSVRLDGAPGLRRRPMEPLYAALEAGGVRVARPPSRIGQFPVRVRGPLRPTDTTISVKESSQFLSALALVLPSRNGTSTVRWSGKAVSGPYLEATRATLRSFGVELDWTSNRFTVTGPQKYRASVVRVPGDASSAAYFLVGAALTGGRVEVRGLDHGWPQADLAVLPLLRQAGAQVRVRSSTATVQGPLDRPFAVDATDTPDLFPLLGVAAACVPGVSRLRGAPHLALKESNRLEGTADLVRAMGAKVRVSAASLEIRGTSRPRAVHLERLSDHRLVMSAAVGALTGNGISRVGDADCVAKSFPGFWESLATLGVPVEVAR